MPSLMDRIFPKAQPQAVPQNTGAGPNPNDRSMQRQQQPTQQLQGPAAGPGQTQEQQPQEQVSPLDSFKDIWQTPTQADGQPKPDPFSQPLTSIDSTKFNEAVSKMNFTAGLTAEDFQAAQQDPAKLADLLNRVAQKSFQSAFQLSNQTIESATKTNNERLNTSMEDKFKRFMDREQRADNPVLNHPSAGPMLDLAKQQLRSRHPDKSAQEIHSMATQFLTDFASELSSSNQQRIQGPAKPDPSDFSSWDS